jgi:hypothetical protein
MSWFAWIGVLAALVIASWAIVNAYGPKTFPSLIMLWIGAFAVASVLPGYLAKHAPWLDLLGPAQPQQAQPMAPPPK